MGKSGIGRLCDLAVALHFGDPLEPVVKLHQLGDKALLPGGRVNPGLWAYEGKVQGPPEKFITPRGSNNHKPIATLLDVLNDAAGRGDSRPSLSRSWRWLTDWYATMSCAHDGSEFLSTEYGGAHAILAMICAGLGIPGAAEHLQRAVALYALHLTADRRLVMPGCRSNRDEVPELEQWARWMLGEDDPRRPMSKKAQEAGARLEAAETMVDAMVAAKTGKAPKKRRRRDPQRLPAPGRELALARRLNARRWVGQGDAELVEVALYSAALPTVRSAPGPLVHRQHERGFVSFFETGPRCYAHPIAAVVAVDGQEPVFVRAPTRKGAKGKGGKGAGEVWSEVKGALLWVSWRSGISVDSYVHDLAPLGALVRETRIPGP